MPNPTDIITIGALSSTAITALVKNPEILKMLYGDLLQPSVRKIGKALETVFNLSNTILLPLKLVNEKTNIIFKKHMDEYMRRIESIKEEEICEIPSEIGIPIIDKLSYVQDENIASMFIALLENSSSIQNCSKVHPLFISIVNNLSPDEAVFIKNISFDYNKRGMDNIPFKYVNSKEKGKEGSEPIIEYLIPKSLLVGIKYQSNYNLYIDNLISLGIFKSHIDMWLVEEDVFYKPIENEYKDELEKIKENLINKGKEIEIDNGVISITQTGKVFIDAIGLK